MKILILSHFFYPYSLVGAKRMISLTRYLKSNGHDVMILKASNECYGKNILYDNDMFDNFETVEVCSSSWLGWIKSYCTEGSRVCRDNRPDCIVVSGGPFNYFLSATYIKKKYGIPLIVDFRDVAAHKIIAPEIKKKQSEIQKRVAYIKNYIVEFVAIKYADKVILTTDVMRQFYMSRFPKYQQKMEIIYNGYEKISINKNNFLLYGQKSMTLAIFGKFSYYGNQNAEYLSIAIRNLIQKGLQIKVIQIGVLEEVLEEKLRDLGCYYNIPTVPYGKGLEILNEQWVMVTSNYLKEAVSTKVFDYIYLNHPILALVPKNSASEIILNEFENSFFAYDEETITSSLLKIWKEKITCLTSDTKKIEKYSRDSQNEKFLKLIEQLSGKNS